MHAVEEMEASRMDTDDVRFILRNGTVTDTRCEEGSWRYRFRVEDEGAVVIVFRSKNELVVVTAWR